MRSRVIFHTLNLSLSWAVPQLPPRCLWGSAPPLHDLNLSPSRVHGSNPHYVVPPNGPALTPASVTHASQHELSCPLLLLLRRRRHCCRSRPERALDLLCCAAVQLLPPAMMQASSCWLRAGCCHPRPEDADPVRLLPLKMPPRAIKLLLLPLKSRRHRVGCCCPRRG